MPKFTGGGGGPITPEMLRLGKAALKKVTPTRITLPGPENSAISRGIRLLAYRVKATLIIGVRLGARSTMREFPGDFYTEPQMISLAGPLNSIARGAINPDHDNFNTDYRNLGRELPSGLFKTHIRRRPFSGQKIYYTEYGWKRTIDPTRPWFQETRTGLFAQVPSGTQRALQGYWRVRGNQINVDRLIISETGEIIYTPDHYASFYRYSMAFMGWYRYESAERMDGLGAEWDASFYHDAA